ncbi:receptor expression-enhancing protein 3-like [Oncorhynchus masou masou]|uniref:receptor expression-enhancing protein 3-like n=1 Tax=Oncorhynchus masou masou TaxID=90313 RepID=UPI003183A217
MWLVSDDPAGGEADLEVLGWRGYMWSVVEAETRRWGSRTTTSPSMPTKELTVGYQDNNLSFNVSKTKELTGYQDNNLSFNVNKGADGGLQETQGRATPPFTSMGLLVFGTLYPAYYSYKAVKTKNVKEYVRWMMYWIVFALYTVVETITDLTVAWFPLYYEIKIAFVIWLLSPYTRGASLIYRKCLHPLLSSREREIDEYIVQAKERSYETMVTFGKQGLSIAATAAVSAAVKARPGAITEKLRSFSMHDLTQIPLDDAAANQIYTAHAGNPAVSRRALAANSTDRTEYPVYDQEDRTDEEGEQLFSEDEAVTQRGLRRSQSVKIVRSKARKDARYGSLKIKGKRRPVLTAATYSAM